MKIFTILGTRPNFIKHFAFQQACEKHGVDLVTAHTGQHYDHNMSDAFFDELDLKPADYVLDLKKSTPAEETAEVMRYLERVIYQEAPAVTVVYGDVTSTMAGALASSKLGVPVAHVEAGVHTDSRFNPEELNRRVTEVCAHTLFAHTEHAHRTLLDSGFAPENAILTGDIVKDSLSLILDRQKIGISDQGYVALTLHRAENTDDVERLTAICGELIASSRQIRYPVHPRARQALEKHGLWQKLEACDHIELLPPLGYVDNIRLLAGAERVVSDSGGVRREAYILGKPVVSLTELVWVPEMVECGWELVAGANAGKIRDGLETFTPPPERPEIFGDGEAADRMVRFLLDRYGGENRVSHPTGLANENSLVSASLSAVAERVPEIPRAGLRRALVTVVIPCHNEEGSLPTLFYRLDQLYRLIDSRRYRLQLVLVDDGSTDDTWDMLSTQFEADSRVQLLRSESNRGYGAALRKGLLAAQGEIVVTADADTNYDIRECLDLLRNLTGDVSLVTASPFMTPGRWNYPVHRFIFSRGVVTLYRFLLKERAGDIMTFTCGFRAYRRAVIDRILPEADDFLASAEILIRALISGLNVRQVPATIFERQHGRSKLRAIPTMIRHLGFMWQIWRGKIQPRAPGEGPAGDAP